MSVVDDLFITIASKRAWKRQKKDKEAIIAGDSMAKHVIGLEISQENGTVKAR